MIAVVASACLIFIIMLGITRSVVASAVIVGTVALSLGSAFRIVGPHLAAHPAYATALARAAYGHHCHVGRRIHYNLALDSPIPRRLT